MSRPDNRCASMGDRYIVALVTKQPWAWSRFLRRLSRASAEVMVFTDPLSARIATEAHEKLHGAMLVTILCPTVIADAARYAEDDEPNDHWTAPVVAYCWGDGWPVCDTDLDAHYRAMASLKRGGNMHGDLLGEDALVVVGWALGWWDAQGRAA